jgi:pimeloyl-ACP methyl ester carboxylesterase
LKLALLILLPLALLLAGLAAWLYTPDKPEAALRAKYDDRFTAYLETDGIRLRVRDTGPKTAPALILLHGFGASLDTWEAWAAILSQHYRVIRFDLPGFGLTGPDPTGDYSDQRATQIIAALLDQLDIQSATIIGNSLGGRIAWHFAAAYPNRVDKLVLISPDGFASPGFDYGKPPDIPFVMKLLPYTLPKFLLRANLAVAYANPKNLTPATLMRYHDLMLAPGDRAAILARMSQTILQDPTPTLRQIQAPTLILWGAQDHMIPISNATDYQRDIPHNTLVTLPTQGHVPFEEAPSLSIAPVLAFLATSASKQGQGGFAPLDPPLKAQPLEPDSGR